MKQEVQLTVFAFGGESPEGFEEATEIANDGLVTFQARLDPGYSLRVVDVVAETVTSSATGPLSKVTVFVEVAFPQNRITPIVPPAGRRGGS